MDTLTNVGGMFPNPILNSVTLGVPPDEPYIVDRLLPIVSSPTMQFDILKTGDDANQFEEDDLRAIGGESNEIDYGQSKTSGSTVEHSLKKILDSIQIEQARRIGDYFRVGGVASTLTNPEVQAQIFVRNRILKGREVRGARILQTAANYPVANRVSGFNALTGDLEASIDAMRSVVKSSIVGIPRVLWMAWDVWQAVKKNTVIRGRIFGTAAGGIVTPQQVAALLGVDEIVIGSSTYATKTGGVVTNHDVWTGTMGLMYVPPTPANGVPAFGYTFTTPYDGAPPANSMATGSNGGNVTGFGGDPGQTQLGMAFQEPMSELRMAYYYKERYRHIVLKPEAAAIWTGMVLS